VTLNSTRRMIRRVQPTTWLVMIAAVLIMIGVLAWNQRMRYPSPGMKQHPQGRSRPRSQSRRTSAKTILRLQGVILCCKTGSPIHWISLRLPRSSSGWRPGTGKASSRLPWAIKR